MNTNETNNTSRDTDLATAITRRSRLTLRVAGAISGDDPWAHGYSEYTGTYNTLRRRARRIALNHGGNPVARLFHKGRPVSFDDAALALDLPFWNWR